MPTAALAEAQSTKGEERKGAPETARRHIVHEGGCWGPRDWHERAVRVGDEEANETIPVVVTAEELHGRVVGGRRDRGLRDEVKPMKILYHIPEIGSMFPPNSNLQRIFMATASPALLTKSRQFTVSLPSRNDSKSSLPLSAVVAKRC